MAKSRDCNDADRLRADPALKLAVGRGPGSGPTPAVALITIEAETARESVRCSVGGEQRSETFYATFSTAC